MDAVEGHRLGGGGGCEVGGNIRGGLDCVCIMYECNYLPKRGVAIKDNRSLTKGFCA